MTLLFIDVQLTDELIQSIFQQADMIADLGKEVCVYDVRKDVKERKSTGSSHFSIVIFLSSLAEEYE